MNLIPRPSKVESLPGVFTLTREAVFVVPFGMSGFRTSVEFLAVKLRAATGFPWPVREGSTGPIVITEDGPTNLGAEGYLLEVTPAQIKIRTRGTAGAFYGLQTLRQLLPAGIEGGEKASAGAWTVPCVRIEDRPRFPWRGFMLDCARHYQPVDLVKRTLEAMAALKMNRFHWHLTEDQGWRLEIKRWPKLTSVGSWRTPAGGERYGGFYTHADVKSIVEFAAARSIEVIPEIELPGHAVAALAAYPELSCTGGPFQVETGWGIFKDVYCAGNDKVLEFLEGVLSEVVELFPSTYIHLGADEVPKDRWKVCPKCQARIKAEKLKDEHELQSWFVHRVIRFLTGKSRRAICWDEILEGGPPPSVIVQAWRAGAKAVSAAAAAGRDVIHSPYSHVYFNEAPTWMDLRHVHSWEPTEEGEHTALTPAVLPDPARLLGGEACLWTEYCPPERVDGQAFPRLLAVAENLWSPSQGKDYAEFAPRTASYRDRLARMGITPGPDRIEAPPKQTG